MFKAVKRGYKASSGGIFVKGEGEARGLLSRVKRGRESTGATTARGLLRSLCNDEVSDAKSARQLNPKLFLGEQESLGILTRLPGTHQR